MRPSAEATRVEGCEAGDASRAIRTFAEAVEQAPGVWAVTVRRCALAGGSFELHLVVHGEFTEDVEPFAPKGWWIR